MRPVQRIEGIFDTVARPLGVREKSRIRLDQLAKGGFDVVEISCPEILIERNMQRRHFCLAANQGPLDDSLDTRPMLREFSFQGELTTKHKTGGQSDQATDYPCQFYCFLFHPIRIRQIKSSVPDYSPNISANIPAAQAISSPRGWFSRAWSIRCSSAPSPRIR